MKRRRFFLGSLATLAAALGGGTLWISLDSATAPEERLIIDPDGTELIFRDGWVVKA